MSSELVSSDVAILDLLRKRDSLSVTQLSEAMGVTSTAVRQRLNRLLAQGYISREVCREARGRPSHRYMLTENGRRQSGVNFADLAIVLWEEIRSIKDEQVRRGLIQRISRRLVELYTDQVCGATVEEKMHSLVELFGQRNVPVCVETSQERPVLNVLACPYPELAEKDRSICSMERIMLSELLGESVRLEKCRLDEGTCCTFQLN